MVHRRAPARPPHGCRLLLACSLEFDVPTHSAKVLVFKRATELAFSETVEGVAQVPEDLKILFSPAA